MASGSKMSASESLQSYLQSTPTPVTTSRSTPTDRGYGTNLPATRRKKKKVKERDRKQRRRAEVRRDLAEEKQPDAATDEPSKEKIRAASLAAAANTPTHEDAGAPCRSEEDPSGASLVSTKTQRKEDTNILVVANVVPRLENQSEGAATGGALAKPMIQVAASVTKLMSQVSVPVAKPMNQAAVSVAGSETVGKPVSDLEVDMPEAVETPVRGVELELEMKMAVEVAVEVAASSSPVLTKATVDGDNADNRQALLSWERLGSLILQRMNQEEERKQSGGGECLLGRNKVTAAVEAAGVFAEEAAAAAAAAEEAAAVATAAAAEAEAVEREENALEGVAAVAPSSSPSAAAAAAAAAAASQSSSSSPSASSPTAKGATVGGDNADEQQALLTREPLSLQCRTADECLDPPKAGTAADAAEKAAEVAAAAAAVAMTAVAAAEAAMAAVVERDLKAAERVRLEEKLLQQVTDELKNRAAEKAAVAKMFALIADDGDGSHDSGSTYMGESSRSSLEDEEVQSAATGQSVVYLVNVGGTCYPINAPPIQQHQQQQQQQQHECGSQCLAYEQCVKGVHSIQAQYADAPHDAMTNMVYSYVDHVGAETCSMPGPLPMQPQHQQQQQQHQHQHHQQTSGGVYLENVGGTFYPVMDMCCSSEAMEYVQDVDGICPFPGPSYYTQQQDFEVVDSFEPGTYPPTADVPEENYPTAMTYEGTNYPYWMQ